MISSFTDLPPDMKKLWDEKFEFNKNVLGVRPEKAAEAADRTIEIVLKLEKEGYV